MASLSLAMMLLLRIAAGLCDDSPALPEDGDVSLPCHLLRWECSEREDCLRDACSYILDICPKSPGCSYLLYKCWDYLPSCNERDSPPKRSSLTKNSFLFMKLHPVLNRAVDPNVSTRYRRIGVRFGSEFLGKRTGPTEEEAEDSGLARGRRLPGTELLGKRWGSEMLGKRNVELLGKRTGEFLGKRRTELLGKRHRGTDGYLESSGAAAPRDRTK